MDRSGRRDKIMKPWIPILAILGGICEEVTWKCSKTSGWY
ncbi:hypothetical protein (plasmid) [Metabacillus dongyingensis]|nr:hypothetical protein [Metabacillus dongyingensis]